MSEQNMKYVAYYRVSTQQQGRSGLGLEAQQSTVQSYCKGSILASFTDIESGKHDKRPQLTAAIEYAKGHGAKLVIAKLDRLSRDVAFISTLMKTNADFVCCDMPEADRFTIHIFAAMAEREREMISKRTKEALQAYKARGGKLGGPNCTDPAHTDMMRSSRRPLVIPHSIAFIINKMEGKSLAEIANEINKHDHRTKQGLPFGPVQVCRIRQKLGLKK